MTCRQDVQSTFSKTDNIRERELYRYYRPLDSPPGAKAPNEALEESGQVRDNTLTAHAATSPDTTLTAFAQLCCLRLQAQRAMIRLQLSYMSIREGANSIKV